MKQFPYLGDKIWSSIIEDPEKLSQSSNVETIANEEALFYPKWTIEVQPAKLKKFLNDKRMTFDDPKYDDYYDYDYEYHNSTDTDNNQGQLKLQYRAVGTGQPGQA